MNISEKRGDPIIDVNIFVLQVGCKAEFIEECRTLPWIL